MLDQVQFIITVFAEVDSNQEALELLAERINWVLSLGIGLVISILANLATNPVQDLIARFSKSRATKRISQIQEEVKRLEEYSSGPLKLIAHAIKSLLSIFLLFGLAQFILAVVGPLFYLGIVTELLSPLIVGYLYLTAILIAQKVLSDFSKLDEWPKYKNQQEAIIRKLEP